MALILESLAASHCIGAMPPHEKTPPSCPGEVLGFNLQLTCVSTGLEQVDNAHIES